MRPDLWNCSETEWNAYMLTDEGKADKKNWGMMEEQRQNRTRSR